MAPNWLTADQNGRFKLVSCHNTPDADVKHPDLDFSLDVQPVILSDRDASPQSVHRLSANTHSGVNLVAAVFADGGTSLYDANSIIRLSSPTPIAGWKEPIARFNALSDEWVGLDVCPSGILQCTQKGRARFTIIGSEEQPIENNHERQVKHHKCDVPMGIRHFKAAPSGAQFAYAGKEVNLSLWDTERAFGTGNQSQLPKPENSSKKRDRESLFPGEIWRAKNIGHDTLDLRQPINIASLAFLDSASDTSTKSHYRIAVGNTLGFVHQYDTRKGKKPASSWKDERMGGGVSLVEKGLREHELYIADCTTQLWAIDLRKTTGPLYAYKGLSGKVTAMATSPETDFIAAGAFDRYLRLLTPTGGSQPNVAAKSELSGHGKVVGKVYMTAAPSAIIALNNDESVDPNSKKDGEGSDEEGGAGNDEDWGDLQEVSSDEEAVQTSRKRRRKE